MYQLELRAESQALLCCKPELQETALKQGRPSLKVYLNSYSTEK